MRLNTKLAKLSAYMPIPNLLLDAISRFMLIVIGLLDIV